MLTNIAKIDKKMFQMIQNSGNISGNIWGYRKHVDKTLTKCFSYSGNVFPLFQIYLKHTTYCFYCVKRHLFPLFHFFMLLY